MKRLYIPGKVWLNQNDFVNEFPQTLVSLFMLLYDSFGPTIKGDWDYDSKINAYRDIIRNVLSPEFPLTIRFQPAASQELYTSYMDETCKRNFTQGSDAYFKMHYVDFLGAFANLFLWTEEEAKTKTAAFVTAGASVLTRSSISTISKLTETRLNCAKVYRDRIVDDYVRKGFNYFEIKSSSEWRQLNETYGISDINKIPANTISYCVTNLPPPVPEGINWQTPDFWSALFSNAMGISILNAVAQNLPVKIKISVYNWKNPDQYLANVVKEEDKKQIKTTFTFVWQDFEFEVDAKCSILVKYNRGTDSATTVQYKDSSKLWLEILMGVGIVLGGMALLTVLAPAATVAPAATGSAVAGAVNTGATLAATAAPTAAAVPVVTAGASITGTAGAAAALAAPITLSVPSVVTPALTGIAGYSELMAMGAGGAAITGAAITGAAITAPIGIAASTVAGEVGKATIMSTIAKAAPAVGEAVAKAGIGVWTEQQKTKIQEEMLKAGYSTSDLSIIPEGATSEGTFVYKKAEAGLFAGLDTKTLLLIGGGALALIVLAGREKEEE